MIPFLPIGVLQQQVASGGGGGGGCVVSVEKIVIDFAGALTKTVNLTKGQDETQSVPFYSIRADQTWNVDEVAVHMVQIDIIDNAGTPAVKIDRKANPPDLQVIIYVVEFNSDISIQRITHTSITGTLQTWTASCTAVDQTKAFLLYSAMPTSAAAGDDINDAFIRVKFNSNTEIGIARDYGTPGMAITGLVWVIEDTSGNHFDVQAVSENFTSASQTVDKTISSVDMSTTMIISTQSCNNIEAIGSRLDDSRTQTYLLDSTNVRIKNGINQHYVEVFVVTWKDGTSVQRGIKSGTVGTSNSLQSTAVSITTVDYDFSIAISTWHCSHGWCAWPVSGPHSMERCMKWMVDLDSDGAGFNLRVWEAAVEIAWELPWEVVEFAVAA